MYWLLILVLSLVVAFVIYLVTGFLNEWLGRERSWVDHPIAIMALPLAVFISPMFMEYTGHPDDDEMNNSKVVSFDDAGNVMDSSDGFVWCVTNNCANAPWHTKVDFDESAIVDGRIVRFVIAGEVEVTDYNRFFTIPGVKKPTGWWNTPSRTDSSKVLMSLVEELLCQLTTNHASELAQIAPVNLTKEDKATILQVSIERHLAPTLYKLGITFKALEFEVKKGCACPSPAELPPQP